MASVSVSERVSALDAALQHRTFRAVLSHAVENRTEPCKNEDRTESQRRADGESGRVYLAPRASSSFYCDPHPAIPPLISLHNKLATLSKKASASRGTGAQGCK